ncbi:TIR domain-containing protein [Nitrospinota bacterium]
MPIPNKQTVARIYFSFSYADYNSASIVYNACKIKRIPSSIFFDQAVWNEARKKGDGATKELIDRALLHSDLTVFLIGRSTYCDTWCAYALRKSIENKKGIFGIYLPNQMQQGKAEWLSNKGFQVYEWESSDLRIWIMTAIQKSLTKAS